MLLGLYTIKSYCKSSYFMLTLEYYDPTSRYILAHYYVLSWILNIAELIKDNTQITFEESLLTSLITFSYWAER